MELFIDKYKPDTFDVINFSEDSNTKLISLAKSQNVPHIILRGFRGSGKRTRALMFLKEKFGQSVFNIKNYTLEVDVPNKKEPISLQIMTSPYHFQFNPSVHGVYDRVLIKKFIDEIVKFKILSHIPYRVVIIEDADLLTHEAQQSLRRTLETRIKHCRFIFIVNQEGHLIDPIYSRCSIIGVASPTHENIVKILEKIRVNEGFPENLKLLELIAHNSDRNLTTAIHTLQRIWIEKGIDGLTKTVVELDCNMKVIEEIIKTLISGTDITIFMNEVRSKINELFVNGVSGTNILLMLFKCAISKLPKSDTELILNICKNASDYDNSIRLGGKSTYHIEAFCLKLFKDIKLLMIKNAKAKKNNQTPTTHVETKQKKLAPIFISKTK